MAFDDLPLVYVPENDFEEACWTWPGQCLWEAPAYMITKYPLRSSYENIQDSSLFTFLFHDILNIGNVSFGDLLEELRELQKTECSDFDLICNIYKQIDKMTPQLDSLMATEIR
jgi:hypothetical protein